MSIVGFLRGEVVFLMVNLGQAGTGKFREGEEVAACFHSWIVWAFSCVPIPLLDDSGP